MSSSLGISFQFEGGRVHAWVASKKNLLDGRDSAGLLDAGDLQQEKLWRNAQGRTSFRAGRTLARRALSELDSGVRAPSHWTFQSGLNGRPQVEDFPDISFNISHSGDGVAFAASFDMEVGVDIEPLKSAAEIGVIADVLTPREICWLNGFDASERPAQFLKLWTMKEACAKALSLNVGDWRDLDVRDPQNIRLDGRILRARAWREPLTIDGERYEMSIVALDRRPERALAA
jgi:4'-phosphopantetheinyl transferase